MNNTSTSAGYLACSSSGEFFFILQKLEGMQGSHLGFSFAPKRKQHSPSKTFLAEGRSWKIENGTANQRPWKQSLISNHYEN